MSNYQIIGLTFAAVGVLSLIVLGLEARKHKTLDLSYLPLSKVLITLSRIMIGVLFAYSGFVKANDYIGFAYKLEEYFSIFGEQWPILKGFFHFFIPYAEVMAWFISIFEIGLAVALLTGYQMVATSWLSLLMMIFFTILTGYSHFTGAVTDCGCFGDALKIEPWESFAKDIILTAMLIPIFLARKYIAPFPTAKLAMWASLGSFVASGIFAYYCHENLPVVDYRAYKKGVNLPYCTTTPGPDGIPKCKDWYPFFQGEEADFFSGYKLVIVMYNLEKANENGLEKAGALLQTLQGSNIQAIATTATGPSRLGPYIEAYQLQLPFAFMDETVLKTIVRSNPGYMLLKDGDIVEKWHHNNTPDLQTLKKALK